MKILDVLNSPWAIKPENLNEIVEIYGTHLRGEKIDVKGTLAALGKPAIHEPKPYTITDEGVAIVYMEGILAKKMNLIMEFSGGTSMRILAQDIARAAADQDVRSILLVTDSPGGTADGTQELVRAVRAAAAEKPVVAWVDGMMASAAYWIGSAASAIFIGEDVSQVGSIGVALRHVDYSRREEMMGLKTTEIYSGKYKRIASSSAPLSAEGRAYLQEQTDYIYTVFVNDVAENRGVTPEKVLSDMADGRIFIGRQAITAGLVDGASTFDAVLADLSAGKFRRRGVAVAGAATAESEAASDAGDASDPQPDTKGNDMNLDQLQKEHPALVQAIRDDAHKAGLEKGRAEGAAAELERIKGVEAAALPGHEQLIAQLKFDGKTSPGEAALQVNSAERAKLGSRAAAIREDAKALSGAAPAPTASAAGTPPAPEAGKDDGKPLEERCKDQWEKDAQVRAEFGSLEEFTAFKKAEASGRIRILGNRKSA